MAVEPLGIEPDYLPWSKFKDNAWNLHFGIDDEIPPAPLVGTKGPNERGYSGDQTQLDKMIAFFAPLFEILIFGSNGDPLFEIENLVRNHRNNPNSTWQSKWWGDSLIDMHAYIATHINQIREEYSIKTSYLATLPVSKGPYSGWIGEWGQDFHLKSHTKDRRKEWSFLPFLSRPSQELLELHTKIQDELSDRGILRTGNQPSGDYAEWLVALHVEGERLGMSAKGIDVVTSSGRRIQVKARTVDSNSRKPAPSSAIRDWDFTEVIFILFNRIDYSIVKSFSVPLELMKKVVKYAKHDNKYFVSNIWNLESVQGVSNITEDLQETQRLLSSQGH